jgi:hypothetical protein
VAASVTDTGALYALLEQAAPLHAIVEDGGVVSEPELDTVMVIPVEVV